MNWRTGIPRLYILAWAVWLGVVVLCFVKGPYSDITVFALPHRGQLKLFLVTLGFPAVGFFLVRWVVRGFVTKNTA